MNIVAKHTRRRILELLDGWGGTPKTVARALNITGQTARTHLHALHAEGRLTSRKVPANSKDGGGKPTTEYIVIDKRRALIAKLKASMREHPELGFFMVHPDAPVADPTFSFMTTDKRGSANQHADRLQTP